MISVSQAPDTSLPDRAATQQASPVPPSNGAQSVTSATTAATPDAPPGRELWDSATGPVDADVSQGRTGDCWLMAELAALAEKSPQTIRDAVHEDADGQGADVALISADGTKDVEHVAEPAGGQGPNAPGVYQSAPDAVQPVGGDGAKHTWASIIEAAFGQYIAKHQDASDPDSLHTSDGLSGGWPEHAAELLTGRGPARTDAPDGHFTPDGAWAALQAQGGRPMTAVTRQSSTDVALPNGVEGSHVYSVLGTETDSEGNRYVLARDPKGAASAATSQGIEDRADGVKRFPLDQFIADFDVVEA